MKPVSFFYLGPPKTASTWVFECLKEHPQICATDHSETNFFDIHFHKGLTWYDALFPKCEANQIRIDCTPTYINSLQALERILDYNPDAKFTYGVRNPVDRAFSGYWHVKRTRDITYDFHSIMDTYVWFRAWVEPGLISSQIAWLQDRVGKENCKPIFFDDLKEDKEKMVVDLFDFVGIESNFTPQTLHTAVNVARPKTDLLSRLSNKMTRLVPGCDKVRFLSGKSAYLKGVAPEFRTHLNEICSPEIERLSALTGRDLSYWIK
tara:strand:- start:144572 stop:145363 length:792 start_codon:yes stop_codon:yes gene_type:complete